MIDEELVRKKYQKITKILIEANKTISTMESCTAGLIASLLTNVEGSSAIIKGAFVTYCNEAKVLQGVPCEIISKYGVYSKETAEAMAKACKEFYHANSGIGVTGTFGNIDPDNEDSVPGKVYFTVINEIADGIIRKTVRGIQLPPNLNRYESKLYVANVIADTIINDFEIKDFETLCKMYKRNHNAC